MVQIGGSTAALLPSFISNTIFLEDCTALMVAILRIAGPFFFMGMQISSLRTAFQITMNKSVGGLSPIPFLSLLMNGSVWFIYGSVKNDLTICVPNFTAVAVGAVCVVQFHLNSKERVPLIFYVVVLAIIFSSIYLGSISDLTSLGLMGVFFSILLMGSPLSTVATVIREGNTDSMPFATSLTTFLNCLSWTSYGYIVAHDTLLWLPSFIGMILAIFQLLLFAIYGLPSASDSVSSSAKFTGISLKVSLWIIHHVLSDYSLFGLIIIFTK